MMVEHDAGLSVNGSRVPARRLEALRAVHLTGSQSAAAEMLGVSVPVLHRHLGSLEAMAGTPLLDRTPSGTTLTEEGMRLVREMDLLEHRLRGRRGLTVAGTPISEDLLIGATSHALELDLIISDDARNAEDFSSGLVDVLVLDDPSFLDELGDISWEMVAEDELLHVRRGERYARYAYGAQRIGFRHLDTIGERYTVVMETRSLRDLVSSDLSFFLNSSLAHRDSLRIRSSTGPGLLSHIITAVHRPDDLDAEDVVQRIVERARDSFTV